MTDPPGPEDAHGTTLALTLGQSRSGRRAVPVVTHVLIDPADPALAGHPAADHPEPLAILEAEAIASLIGFFPVVVTAQVPVVPHGDDYRPVAVDLDPAASARRLAGDLGAGVLAFVVGGEDGPFAAGEIGVVEAERRAAEGAPFAAELQAAARFVRAGGALSVVTPPDRLAAALESRSCDGALRIVRDQPAPIIRMAKIRESAPMRSIDEVTSGIPWLSGSRPSR
jgi:carbamate kinase